MMEIINGKRYNTETATKIATKAYHNNGNYSGTSFIGVTPRGNLFEWTFSNGQDCWLNNSISLDFDIDGYDIVNEELAAKFNLIEEA